MGEEGQRCRCFWVEGRIRCLIRCVNGSWLVDMECRSGPKSWSLGDAVPDELLLQEGRC